MGMESNAVLNAVVYQETDGRFTAEIPSCPGCATWGYTREEAVAKLREAATLYFEDEEDLQSVHPNMERVAI